LKESFTEIGRLKKTYGDKGELRFVVFEGFKEAFEKLNYFFTRLDGIYVPFFPQTKFKVESNSLQIEGIRNESEAKEMIGKAMFLPSDQVSTGESALFNSQFDELLGFKLFDQNDKLIGELSRIEEFPMQEMGILTNGKMIPMHISQIIGINRDDHEFCMNLPEGISDL